jgi:hypothetical protein
VIQAPEPANLDRLREAWRQVQATRTSAQHFKARLRRTTPIVAELASIDPQLTRALGVLTAMMANFSLAEDVLGALPLPGDLIGDMMAVEREEEAPADTSVA